MAKITIHNFNGIYSNYDPADLNLEFFSQSINFKHDQGFAKVDSQEIEKVYTPEEGWEIEAGAIGDLMPDEFAEVPSGDRLTRLILVVRHGNARRVKIIDASSIVKDALEYSPNMSPSLLNTDIEGVTKVIYDDGVFKIFMPHDSFWLGRIDRKLELPVSFVYSGISNLDYNNIYFDRLSEPVTDIIQQKDKIDDVNDLKDEYRIGYSIFVEPVTDNDAMAGLLETEKYRFINLEYDPNYYYEPLDVFIPIATMQLENIETQEELLNGFPSLYPKANTPNFAWIKVRSGPLGTTKYWVIPKDALEGLLDLTQPNNLTGLGTEHVANLYIENSHNTQLSKILPSSSEVYKIKYDENSLLYLYNIEYSGENDNAYDTYTLKGETDLEIVGFSSEKARGRFIGTVILDGQTEIICLHKDELVKAITDKFGYKVTLNFPVNNINRRITGYRLYHKFDDDLDYELVYDKNVIRYYNTVEPAVTIGITKNSLKPGKGLSQTIGFALDHEKLKEYKVLTGSRDIITESGLSFMLLPDDYSHVYYSALGDGRVMQDVFYRTSTIPISGLSGMTALSSLNGKVGVSTESELKIIHVESTGGVPTFTLIDSMEYGVKNPYDVVKVQGGSLLNTPNGMYITNGFEKTHVSEQIDDVALESYAVSRIAYNPVKQEFYYSYGGDNYYRFRFRKKAWEGINREYSGRSIMRSTKNIFTDYEGGVYYLTGGGLYRENGETAHNEHAYIVTEPTDLRAPGTDKLINTTWIDFVGEGRLTYYMDDTVIHYDLDSPNRHYMELPMLVDYRVPFLIFKMRLSASPNFVIYNWECDFSVLPRRTYG